MANPHGSGSARVPERQALIHFDSAQAICEIAAALPFYRGVANLKSKGDVVQWGGPRLCTDATFPTPNGKARFTAVVPPADAIPEGWFRLSTRRGKQFNSMVHDSYDPLTGAHRDQVFVSAADARRLEPKEGDPVLLRSEKAQTRGRVKIMSIRLRNIQVHWPEGNVLLPSRMREPASSIPDCNVLAQMEPLRSDDGERMTEDCHPRENQGGLPIKEK